MDLLKAQFAKIQQQLSGLTGSQKMLAFSLVAVMVMTLAYMARYASQADFEPVLNQSFSADQIANITEHLDSRGIKYTVTGDKILVPADQKMEVLGDLGFSHLLPDRTNAAFDDVVSKMSPFDAADKTAQLWLEAKSDFLQAIIDKFPHVRSANVIIDPTDQKRFDGHDVKPTASVFISTLESGEGEMNTRQIAMSAADLVSGAVAGLARSSINVVVDGLTITIPDKSGDNGLLDGDSILDAKRRNEEAYTDKIMKQFGFIKGLFVSVAVDLKTERVDTTDTKVDSKTAVHLSTSEEEHNTDTSAPGAGGEPGAAPNVSTSGAVSAAGGAGGASTSSETETKSTYLNAVPTIVTHTEQAPGDAHVVSAAARVPRSFFIQMYKSANKDAEPDDAALTTLIAEQSAKITQEIKNCTGIKDDSAISVNWYPDNLINMGIAGGGAPAAGSPVTAVILSHVREIGVGMLAMVSLGMVMMMVRKSAVPVPIPVVEDEAELKRKATQRLDADVPLAGEVSEGDKTMDGMEIDDEAVRTQQMIEQVSDMVTENPDAAANLVKRWLNRS